MPARITLSGPKALGAAADAVAIPLFETDLTHPKSRLQALAAVDKWLRGLLLPAAKSDGFQAKRDQLFAFHTHGKIKPKRVFLIGMGPRAKFDAEALRLAAGNVARHAAKTRVQTLAFAVPEAGDAAANVGALAEGAILGSYRFTRYRTSTDGERGELRELRLALPGNVEKTRDIEQTAALAERVARAVCWARDLVNEPANAVTPTRLAQEATALAKRNGLEAEVLDRAAIEKLKMGMFLGVAQGSSEEPRLIHLTYQPKDPAAQKRPSVALVGKAITFDSGGHSLKTQEGMVDMKTDMAGAAAVFAAMEVVAQLAPPFPVHAFAGACENMLDGKAYRLGDVLTSRSGKTVEVLNTDAEGRLVLGDVLTYATEVKPAVIVDLATLTGACMVALGRHIAGAFGEDDAAISSVLDAAKAAGEELWRMPISELQKDQIKSEIADIKNIGERHGGAINAALFLKEFVGETPWVHLDIAGPSYLDKDRGYLVKGATGVGVRTLVELVRRRAAMER